jgi:hypothetical protein
VTKSAAARRVRITTSAGSSGLDRWTAGELLETARLGVADAHGGAPEQPE